MRFLLDLELFKDDMDFLMMPDFLPNRPESEVDSVELELLPASCSALCSGGAPPPLDVAAAFCAMSLAEANTDCFIL
eukprot:1156806-Pelagomonas_calceolata.AAC.12